MKKLLIVLSAFLLICCEKKYESNYKLEIGCHVPDSLKEKHREYINQLVRSANQHLSAGQMEESAYTIRQAKWTADELFCVRIEGLSASKYSTPDFIAPEDMTEAEKEIFKNLKSVKP
jgi:DNA replication initiation complex subunit (GINS family)